MWLQLTSIGTTTISLGVIVCIRKEKKSLHQLVGYGRPWIDQRRPGFFAFGLRLRPALQRIARILQFVAASGLAVTSQAAALRATISMNNTADNAVAKGVLCC